MHGRFLVTRDRQVSGEVGRVLSQPDVERAPTPVPGTGPPPPWGKQAWEVGPGVVPGLLRRQDRLRGAILVRQGWGLSPTGCGTREARWRLRARLWDEGCAAVVHTLSSCCLPSPRAVRTLGGFEPRGGGLAHVRVGFPLWLPWELVLCK